MDQQCFIYINLNSPSPAEQPPTKTSKLSKSHSKTKPQPDSLKEISLINSPPSHKKTNRKQYFPERSQKTLEIVEEKPGKRLKTGEILDSQGERRAVFLNKPANTVSKTQAKPHKSRENGTKPEKIIRNEKLSLDEYLKKIEKELNLEDFTHKAETFQKDLNLLEENIQENKILEEFKQDFEANPLQKIQEKAQIHEKSPIVPQQSSLEKTSENIAETPGFSIDLLKQTINEVKKLKKEQQQAFFREAAIAPSKTKLFLHSSQRNPNQPQYKLANFPETSPISLKKRKYNKVVRGIYKELLAVELEDDEFACDVCMSKDFDSKNRIIICDLCEGAVHQKCYGNELIRYIPEGVWYCSRCKYLIENQLGIRAIKCMFCPEIKGILKMVNSSQYLWAHISCVLAVKCVDFLDGKDRDLVNLDEFYKKNGFELCCLCKIPYGVTVNCEFKQCDRNFHVSCAQRQGFLLAENSKFQCVCKSHQKLYNVASKRNFLIKKQQDFKKNPLKSSLFLDSKEYVWVNNFNLHENQPEIRENSQEISGKKQNFTEKNADFDADFMICLVDNEEKDKRSENLENFEKTGETHQEMLRNSEIEEEKPANFEEIEEGNHDFVIHLAKDDDIIEREVEKKLVVSENLKEIRENHNENDKKPEFLEEKPAEFAEKPLKKVVIELDDEIIGEESKNFEENKEKPEEIDQKPVKSQEETVENQRKPSEKEEIPIGSEEINNILSEVKRMFMDVSLDL